MSVANLLESLRKRFEENANFQQQRAAFKDFIAFNDQLKTLIRPLDEGDEDGSYAVSMDEDDNEIIFSRTDCKEDFEDEITFKFILDEAKIEVLVQYKVENEQAEKQENPPKCGIEDAEEYLISFLYNVLPAKAKHAMFPADEQSAPAPNA